MTDGQPASLSWYQAPIWDLRADFFFCLTVVGLLIWGALYEERMNLSLVQYAIYNIFTFYMLLHECIYAINPCQIHYSYLIT
jgi:hypothetical protein